MVVTYDFLLLLAAKLFQVFFINERRRKMKRDKKRTKTLGEEFCKCFCIMISSNVQGKGYRKES